MGVAFIAPKAGACTVLALFIVIKIMRHGHDNFSWKSCLA